MAKFKKNENIIVGKGLLKKINKLFNFGGYSQIFIICDIRVKKLFLKKLNPLLKNYRTTLIALPSGERIKSFEGIKSTYRSLIENKADRQSLIVNFGGGTISDVGGFIASTFMRGIDFINIPTTFLAQVDAAIGGKNGINFSGIKNVIGTFYQPKLVINDIDLFKSLSKKEFLSGLAEVIKYGLIMDKKLFEFLERKKSLKFSDKELIFLVRRCTFNKMKIVRADEKDTRGVRTILNFGHTLGHAIESVGGLKKFTHGEAISLGMVFAAKLSRRLKMLSQNNLFRIMALFKKFSLPINCRLNKNKILSTMEYDKKISSGKINWVLFKKIGRANSNQKAPQSLLSKTFSEFFGEI